MLLPLATFLWVIHNTLLYTSGADANIQKIELESHTAGCQKPDNFFCMMNNTYVVPSPFNNSLGHSSLNDALGELHESFYLFNTPVCGSRIKLFLCSLYVPVCVPNFLRDGQPKEYLDPCRETCTAAREACSTYMKGANDTWRPHWDCNRFKTYVEQPLCVIKPNNHTELSQVNPTPPLDIARSGTHAPFENETGCADDTFDCKLSHPSRSGQKLYCIEKKFVCDGKVDCPDDGHNSGLDEVGCEKCEKGQLYCDERCIESYQLCDGRVDCISGVDESDCHEATDRTLQQIQAILCVVALAAVVYVSIKLRRSKEPPEVPKNEIIVEQVPNVAPPSLYSPHERLSPAKEEDINPIYHEPPYYERLNIGGRSGASSVYAYSSYAPMDHWSGHAHTLNLTSSAGFPDDIHERAMRAPPPAPPPTPYQVGPQHLSRDFDEHLENEYDISTIQSRVT